MSVTLFPTHSTHMNLRLTVKLDRGRNLKAMDLNGKSDPYCKLRLTTGGPTLRSKVITNNLNPEWNDLFHFPIIDPNTESLEIQCFDSDLVGKDDFLGCTIIPLYNLPVGATNQVEQWFPIYEHLPGTGNLGRVLGEIQLVLTLEKDILVPKPFVSHSSTVIGGLVGSLGEGFCTYELGMWHIGLLFGNQYQSFNPKYDKAQQIFGADSKAAMARKTIRVQHAELYRQGWARSKGGTITTGEDFLKLLNYGERQGSRRMFTYALMDDALFFSETGASFFKDFMSKHATHSNASEIVRYAGEFQVRKDPYTGGYLFVIDNNSGTYAPDKALLSNLAELFRLNFPGLMVQALHYEDPILKQYRSEYEEQRQVKLQNQKEHGLTTRIGKALGLSKYTDKHSGACSVQGGCDGALGTNTGLAAGGSEQIGEAFSHFPSTVPNFQVSSDYSSAIYPSPSPSPFDSFSSSSSLRTWNAGPASYTTSSSACTSTVSSTTSSFNSSPYSPDPYSNNNFYPFCTGGEFLTPTALSHYSSSDPLGTNLIPTAVVSSASLDPNSYICHPLTPLGSSPSPCVLSPSYYPPQTTPIANTPWM